MPQISTRAANKNRHPGVPDLPTARRSSKVVREERTALAAAATAARKEQQVSIRLTAEIEDQLQSQMKTQHTKFLNPTSAAAKVLKPLPMPMPAPDNAIGRVPASQRVPAQAEGEGESRDAETEKGISTLIYEASTRTLTFFAIQKLQTLSASQSMVGLSAPSLPVM